MGSSGGESSALQSSQTVKRKPLDEKTPDDYGVNISPRLEILKTTEPAARAAGVKVSDVAELVSKLKDEAGVI